MSARFVVLSITSITSFIRGTTILKLIVKMMITIKKSNITINGNDNACSSSISSSGCGSGIVVAAVVAVLIALMLIRLLCLLQKNMKS